MFFPLSLPFSSQPMRRLEREGKWSPYLAILSLQLKFFDVRFFRGSSGPIWVLCDCLRVLRMKVTSVVRHSS